MDGMTLGITAHGTTHGTMIHTGDTATDGMVDITEVITDTAGVDTHTTGTITIGAV